MSSARGAVLASLVIVLATTADGTASRQAVPTGVGAAVDSGAGVLVVDLASWRSIFVQRPELVNARVVPGAVLKVATLMAALDSGIVSPATRFTCRRKVTAGDRQLVCLHPDLGRPLTPAEALAHSCNDFFVTIGQRLSREALSAATSSLGLGPIAPGVPVPLAAVGLAGIETTPEQLLRAFVRLLDPAAKLRPETREVLLEGLRGSAVYGAAQGLGAAGIDALAQAGTVPMRGGPYQGLAVALAPSGAPSRGVAVVLPGGSAADAAAIAAQALNTPRTADAGGGSPISSPPPAARGASEARPAAVPQAQVSAGRPPNQPPTTAWSSASGMTLGIGRLRAGSYEVTSVPLEEYVARVVAGEAAPRSSASTLEAIAIAVRTFAVVNLARHQLDGFNLCDQTHCQVMAVATAATRQAAEATAGRVLLYRGAPAPVFYTASCGGRSELPEDVWPRASNLPFLKRHKESQCRESSAWQSQMSADDLLRALHGAGFTGAALRNVKVTRRSGSGRAAVLRIEGLLPGQITGDELRLAVGRHVGWQYLKSTAFDVKRKGSVYRFSGHGSGHGVGMCLIGATRMGAEGKTAAAILKEYFPGTTIGELQ
ncbi:MAG: SpoIID/LytB domain-containing protein [Bacteroidales bacterium]